MIFTLRKTKKTTIDKLTTISLENYGFSQQMLVKTTRNKNSYLKVDRNNNILFTKSIYMTQQQVDDFLQKNLAKIIDAQRIAKENIPYNLEEGWVILFGNYYNLKYIGSGNGHTIDGKNIFIKGRDINSAFKNFCKAQEIHIIKLANELAAKVGITTLIKVKCLKAVWGNCTPLKNTISLNKKLVFFSKSAIEYVIYHELAHYSFQNHKKEFWNLVARWCPNYKLLKKELKNW